YAVAVACAGFSPNIGAAFGISRPDQIYLLIGFRAVQGIGMGMLPLGFAMLPELFPADRVAQAQGIISAMFAAGACLGLVGGGYLAQTYGWPFTYHTIIPVAIVLPLLALWKVPESTSRTASSLDLPGISALGLGIAALMLGITAGSVRGWTNFASIDFGPVPWGAPEFFIASALLIGFFAYWETRTPEPVIRLASLKVRNILVANVDGFVVGATMFLSFTTNTYLIELPYPPGFAQPEFIMGLIVLPGAVSILVLGPLFGRAVSRWGPKPILLLGFALMAAGALALTQVTSGGLGTFSTGAGLPVPYLMVVGPILLFAGNIATMIAVSNVIVLSVRTSELGVQTAMNQTFRNLGSALAPVIVTSILVAFASGSFQGNPMYTAAGFQACYGVLAGLAVFALLFGLALRNYRRGETAPYGANVEIPTGAAVRAPAS
ncbi:MAG: MFS transporter, partial [Thermoplasmata archaeon]